jgi:uncharacterized protein YkwD
MWLGKWGMVGVGALVVGCALTGSESRAERAPRSEAAEEATAPRRTPSAALPDEPQSAATAEMEDEVLARINQIRQGEGLKPLRINRPLAAVARGFSRQMAVENFFSHDAPSGETFEDRIRNARLEFFRIGENIYKCNNLPKPAESAVKAWINSPGHRKNVLTAEYTETGIGVWKVGKNYYFTQDFIRPR